MSHGNGNQIEEATRMTETKFTRQEAITKFAEAYGMDIQKLAKGIRVKCESHEGNQFAPEKYCYKITFTMFGQKNKFAFWPNSVGYQAY
tara:strand:- start:517 stop:783 length:267 start_codon:yes stop_codon:yes gene_type:complete